MATSTLPRARALKIAEAAEASGRSAKVVREAVKCGALPAKRPWRAANAPYLIRVDDLDEWIKSWDDA